MSDRRVVCSWCPLELPDDMMEWDHHFAVVHGTQGGSSVRFYPALTLEEELAASAD